MYDNKSPEKSFGIVFSVVFLIVAIYPLASSESVHIWAVAISLSFFLSAFFMPNVLIPLNKLWFKFGMLLGSFVSPIVISIVYFATVLPTGVIMRLLGKDLLSLSLNKEARSYWIKRTETKSSMKDQF